MRRLNTDRVDVFFLHRFDDQTRLDETLRAVEVLIQQGKISDLGSYLKSALRSSAVKGGGNRRSPLRKNVSMCPALKLSQIV